MYACVFTCMRSVCRDAERRVCIDAECAIIDGQRLEVLKRLWFAGQMTTLRYANHSSSLFPMY